MKSKKWDQTGKPISMVTSEDIGPNVIVENIEDYTDEPPLFIVHGHRINFVVSPQWKNCTKEYNGPGTLDCSTCSRKNINAYRSARRILMDTPRDTLTVENIGDPKFVVCKSCSEEIDTLIYELISENPADFVSDQI